jgi:hypothetical protein
MSSRGESGAVASSAAFHHHLVYDSPFKQFSQDGQTFQQLATSRLASCMYGTSPSHV